MLALAHDEVQDKARIWEYTVLVTNAGHDIATIGQLYRDRCDCENGFDELKNRWGWGGFTTQDMHRSQIAASTVALVCNWWSWYVRAANPQARREALTSRPLLLAAVGRATGSGNQTTLYFTPMHAEAGLNKSMIANVHAAIQHVRAAALAPGLADDAREGLEDCADLVRGGFGGAAYFYVTADVLALAGFSAAFHGRGALLSPPHARPCDVSAAWSTRPDAAKARC